MTPAAADLAKVLARELGLEPVLRVRVVAGGCAGLTYDLEFGVVGSREGDLRRVSDGVTVVVDRASAGYLRGARVDVGTLAERGLRAPLTDPPRETGFVVRAIPGSDSCSCGESFAPR